MVRVDILHGSFLIDNFFCIVSSRESLSARNFFVISLFSKLLCLLSGDWMMHDISLDRCWREPSCSSLIDISSRKVII